MMMENPWGELFTSKEEESDINILGITFDSATSVGKGTAHGPDKIRECSTVLPPVNGSAESFENLKIYDAGNVEFTLNWEEYFANVENAAKNLIREGKFCLFLGGDHSITIPLSKAFGEKYKNEKIGFIHFDSHPDLSDEYEGSKWSHACPFRRITENIIEPKDLAQIGIKSFLLEEVKFYNENPELLLITSRDVFVDGYKKAIDRTVEKFKDYDAIYLSIDIDVLDPAYAPGTGTPESGGLSARELLEMVNQLTEKLPIKAMDIVEVSPPLDSVNHITSWAAVKIIYEVFARLSKK